MTRTPLIISFSFISLLGLSPSLAQTPSSSAYDQLLGVVRANPSNAEASFLLAQAAVEAGDTRSAISALERILLLNPRLANIRLELGVLYLNSGATALGEQYISEALESPDVPAEVRTRAEGLLAVAAQSQQLLLFEGSVSAGVISDSNANSGPASGTQLGSFTVTSEDSGQSDTSAFVSVGGRLRYDLGLQAGHLAAIDADIYTRSYSDQSDLNSTSFSVAAGLDLNTARSFGFPSDVLLRYRFSRLSRDGDEYLETHGPSVTLRAATESGIQINANIYSNDQDYIPTASAAANDNRDGRETGVSVSLSRALSPVSQAELTFAGTTKSAEEDFEAYDEIALSASYFHQIEKPVDFGAGPWTLGTTLRLSSRDYEGPDPVIVPEDSTLDMDEAQSDTVVSLNAFLSIPIDDVSAIRAEVGTVSQSSNYSIDEYDNQYISLSFSRRF